MEMFLKDIIHDLNTPISSILLNLQILKKKNSQEAIKRIEFSAKNIGSLYNNLESIIKEEDLNIEEINISDLIKEKIEYYSYLYPQIKFIFETKIQTIHSSYNELSRILDNLISNACKYNSVNGFVKIYEKDNKLYIQDNGKGIKYPKKVFERSYSEDENGHGIGMHIVYRLCNELGIDIDIDSQKDISTKVVLKF